MNSNRRKQSLFLLLALISIVILSIGLSDVQFQPGLPIPGAATTQNASPEDPSTEAKPQAVTFGAFLQGTLAVGFVLLLLAFAINLVRKVDGTHLLRLAAALIGVLIVLILLPRIEPGAPVSSPEDIFAETPSQFTFTTAPVGNPPEGLYWFVIGFVGLCVIFIGVWLVREYSRRPKSADSLERAADAAIQAIHEGQNLHSVIIRCYLSMIKVLKDEKGIEREQSVTPREFEQWLSNHGIQEASVRQLTRLFEKARYSPYAPEQRDESAALECLSAISIYCKQGSVRTT